MVTKIPEQVGANHLEGGNVLYYQEMTNRADSLVGRHRSKQPFVGTTNCFVGSPSNLQLTRVAKVAM